MIPGLVIFGARPYYLRHAPVRLVPAFHGPFLGEAWDVPKPSGPAVIRPVFVWWLTGMAPA